MPDFPQRSDEQPSTEGMAFSCVTSLGDLQEDWDVLVVGAGVAGATAARRFAESGCSVLLVERAMFPRYKTCGCCLNLRALRRLSETGIEADLLQHGAHPLSSACILAGGRRATVALPGGLAVSRGLLDSLLVQEAARAGAECLLSTMATLGACDNERRTVHVSRGQQDRIFRARLVIAADGLNGGLLSRAGESESLVGPRARVGLGALIRVEGGAMEPGRIYMACGRAGYAGAVCVEGGLLAIAAAVDTERLRRRGGAGVLVASILQEAGLTPPPDLEAYAWKGTPPLTRRSTRFAGARVLAVGDALGYVEPFSGEGMAWALESAHDVVALAAPRLDNGGGRLEDAWDAQVRKQMTTQRMLCRALARTLRSHAATQMIVSMLSVFPGFSRPIIARLNAETRS